MKGCLLGEEVRERKGLMGSNGPSPASLSRGTLSPEGRGDVGNEAAVVVPSTLRGEGGAKRRVRGSRGQTPTVSAASAASFFARCFSTHFTERMLSS
jgi:hypothetical protein